MERRWRMAARAQPMISSRQIAFDVLMKVDGGGYASDLLTEQCAPLAPRDAGLASAIVLGVLRYRAQLDFLIAKFSGRGTGKLDPEVLTVLRMGVFQIRYLDRIPAHAAVDASVDLVKRARKRSAVGFVNAVLRKVNRDVVVWPDRATELSCREWMLARWEAAFGREAADGIARASLVTPERYVRVPDGVDAPEGAEATEIAGCYRLGAGEAGPFRIQDIGSQSIVPLLDLHEGQRFLDLCAAPGNKTAQALETRVRATACDVSYKRLRGLAALDAPLAMLDGTQTLPFGRVFDRILIDAPCTGTGTLAHNPEIKWRLRPEDFSRHAARQGAILKNALEVLAPGGRLVYSTCSLELEENEAIAAWASPVQTVRRMPGREPGDGFFAAVITR